MGHVTQFDNYTLDGDVGRITAPNGSITNLTYTPRRKIARVAISDGKTGLVTQYSYDAAGQLKQITLPDQSTLSYQYDDAHRLIKLLDAAGNSINYSYDQASKLIKEEVLDASNTLLQTSSRSYDVLNRLTQLQQGVFDSTNPGLGYVTNYEYDSRDRLNKIGDGLQNETKLYRDPLGRVRHSILPQVKNAPTLSQIYIDNDGQDRVRNFHDPRGLNTSYEVDGLGRSSKQSSPDTGVENYQTDITGNLTQKTDARGITSKYSYDALGRLTGISFPSSSASLTYDIGASAKGKLSRIIDSSGRTLWQYDGFGRTVQKDQVIALGGPETLLRQQTRFDANGKVSQITYPSGVSFLHSYAADGKLQAITLVNKDGSRTPITKEMQYTAFGALQSWLWGNHSTLSANSYARGFDAAGRIKFYPLGNALAGGVQRNLRFDAANRLIAYTHTGNATANLFDQHFEYDAMARLISASNNGNSLGYAYDGSGNRTALTIRGNNYANTIDPKSNRLSSTTGPLPAANNTYDKSGNLLSDGSINYIYGENGRLQSARRGFLTAMYFYNAQGQRVAKQVMTVGTGTKTLYAYDDAGHVIGEYDGNGNPIQETLFIGDTPVAVLVPQAATPGKPAVNYIYADHLNTPRVITRASDNKIVWRWLGLGPFGENLPEENPMGLGVFTFNLRFPGQISDAETGLYQNYYREYNPQTARFTTSDPIGLGGGINTFAYVGNNPISRIDPKGLDWGGDLTGSIASSGFNPLANSSSDSCSEERCKDTITVHTGGTCAPSDSSCVMAMKAAGLPPPYTYTTMTLDWKCLLKLGLLVKGPTAAVGSATGKYGPGVAANAVGAAMPRTGAVIGMAGTTLAEAAASPIGITLSLFGAGQFLVKECECNKNGK